MTLHVALTHDSGLKLRKVEPAELHSLAKQVALEANFHTIKEWAKTYYGNDAANVRLDYESESDDEGGSYIRISYASVTDKKGTYLSPDFQSIKAAPDKGYGKKYVIEALEELYANTPVEDMTEDDFEDINMEIRGMISEMGWDNGGSWEDHPSEVNLSDEHSPGGPLAELYMVVTD